MNEIVQGMSHPITQFPSLVCFLGNKSRVPALRSLFPDNNVTRRGPAGLARLHLSTKTANTEHPVLFAESSFNDPLVLGECCQIPSSADRHRQYPIPAGTFKSTASLKHHIMSRLLFPWTHVACLFVDGMAEFEMARSLLEDSHTVMQVGCHAAPPNLMRVVIVLTDPKVTYETDFGKENMRCSDLADTREPTVSILDLRDRHQLSPAAAFEPLHRLLLDDLHISRTRRNEQGLLFSAVHLNFLWNRALQQGFLASRIARVDCLQVARERLPVNPSFQSHLVNYLEQSSKAGCSTDEVYTFVASAILMDAYPPGMHSEWN